MIRGIIFDLGHTLIRFPGDRRAAQQAGAEAVADWYLKKKRVKLDQAGLSAALFAEYEAGQRRGEETQTEVVVADNLRAALTSIEAPERAFAFIDEAVKVFFEQEEAGWERYPEAEPMLKTFYEQGCKLGIYSNAADDGFVQRLINSKKIRPWVSPTFSSAGLGWRKPSPDGFALILERWQLPPEAVIVVGDRLDADILGAHNAGLRSILVTMDEHPTNDHRRDIVPTLTAASLAELPGLIAGLP